MTGLATRTKYVFYFALAELPTGRKYYVKGKLNELQIYTPRISSKLILINIL